MKLAFKFRKPTTADAIQAFERAVRFAVAAFVAVYPFDALVNSPFDGDLAKKAAIAGGGAAATFLWRWLLPDFGRSLPTTK